MRRFPRRDVAGCGAPPALDRYTAAVPSPASEPTPLRPGITARVFRPGETPPEDNEWLKKTVQERIEAVWTLTLIAHGWAGEGASEPRLQRSVVHIQRKWR